MVRASRSLRRSHDRRSLELECLERRDCPAGLSIADISIDEGTTATTVARFKVSLSEKSAAAVSVNWATSDGTATLADDDYRVASGTIVFSPGQTSKTVAVYVRGDAKQESDETFQIVLSNPVGATLTKDTATATIRNDDAAAAAIPTLSVNDVQLPERKAGRSDAVFTVTLSAPTTVPVTVDYATADITATTADGDYVATSWKLTFSPGETSKKVSVGVLGDSKIESDESFKLVLKNPVGATLDRATGTATIVNDDKRPVAAPVVSVSSVSLLEGDGTPDAITYAEFDVRLSTVASSNVVVAYATVDATAKTFDKDYLSTKGTVTFLPGETLKKVQVPVIGDTKWESSETFSLVLSSATGASIARTVATATIGDDDTPPEIAVSDVSVAEGDSGSTSATFVVSLSYPWTKEVTVAYTTRDGSATAADPDYTAATGTLTFAPGETSKTVDVQVLGDTKAEAYETFSLALSSPVNARLGKATGVATIRNDDAGAWTIMVYMTGENLNTFARDDINEMEKALADMPAGVNIVVSWDQPKSSMGTAYATGNGTQAAWRSYGRGVLTADTNTSLIASSFDLSVGEKDTGDPATLVDFVNWGVQQAPAAHYLLQMWGHGGGLEGSQFDSESGGDAMEIGEIAAALATPGMPSFDIVSYDNCLMAMAEVGYAISSATSGLFVASEELINGTGQDYTTAYSALKSPADPFSVVASSVAASMVASYGKQYQNDRDQCDTFSATRTTNYAGLATVLGQFVAASASLTTANRTTVLSLANNAITYDDPSFRDLGSFMKGVAASNSLPSELTTAASAVNQSLAALVANKTADQRGSSGVSIYLPTKSTDSYLPSYSTDAAAFCQATGWDAFARWLATGSRSAAPSGSAGKHWVPASAPASAGSRAVQAIAAADNGNGWANVLSGAGGATASTAAVSRRAVQRAFAGMA